MNYAIVESGIVTNIIVADEQTAAVIGALQTYDGCSIGKPYAVPTAPTEMEVAQQAITDLELNDIAQGQQITDLELLILSGGGTTGG